MQAAQQPNTIQKETNIQCDRAALELRLVGSALKPNRQVLFLLADVEAALGLTDGFN